MSRRPAPWTRIRSGLEQDFTILRVHKDVFVDPRDGSEHARAIIDADDWANVVALTLRGHHLQGRAFPDICFALDEEIVADGRVCTRCVVRHDRRAGRMSQGRARGHPVSP